MIIYSSIPGSHAMAFFMAEANQADPMKWHIETRIRQPESTPVAGDPLSAPIHNYGNILGVIFFPHKDTGY
jgi:hypothetical protein